jgi:hypothetical protein
MNKRGEEEGIDNERPLMFGLYPMIRVENAGLGLLDGAEPGIVTAMRYLFNSKKIPQRFEWNGNEWQKRVNPNCPVAVGQTVYGLASAIVRTKLGDAYEYLSVHWPEGKLDNLFIKM